MSHQSNAIRQFYASKTNRNLCIIFCIPIKEETVSINSVFLAKSVKVLLEKVLEISERNNNGIIHRVHFSVAHFILYFINCAQIAILKLYNKIKTCYFRLFSLSLSSAFFLSFSRLEVFSKF